jgi:predicted transporter
MSLNPVVHATIVGGLFFILSSVTLMAVMSVFIMPMTEHGLSQHEIIGIWLIDGLLLLVSVAIGRRIYQRHLPVQQIRESQELKSKLPNQAL